MTPRADPVGLGIALAGVLQLLEAVRLAVRPRPPSRGRVERAGVSLVSASLLLAATRRLDWRTPALATAMLTSLPARPLASGTAARRVLPALGAAALVGLLQETSRADRWERHPGAAR